MMITAMSLAKGVYFDEAVTIETFQELSNIFFKVLSWMILYILYYLILVIEKFMKHNLKQANLIVIKL